MRPIVSAIASAAILSTACAGSMDKRTLSSLHRVEPDLEDARVDVGLEQALMGYRKFLDEAPQSALTPEAMRRLADLQLEKEYGYIGEREAAAPERAAAPVAVTSTPSTAGGPTPTPDFETEDDFQARASASVELPSELGQLALPAGEIGTTVDSTRGPLEAIELYDKILTTYPDYPNNDEVLYQKARAYDELGRNDEAIEVIDQLIATYPNSRAIDEAQFRRAEYFFTRRRFLDAEESYLAVTRMGPASRYYELALYKLGWTFYKQDMHDEALDTYMSLLDHKVAIGYDFEASNDESDERRIADTFRVISLSFSAVGGADVIEAYFAATGTRTYEDKIYSHLGEFYLEKLRYADAADAYEAFVQLHPIDRASPGFSMRVVEIYELGGFGRLVLEAKKTFAQRYALESEYWLHFPIESSPEVVEYLKGNLQDLASHYHAMYQQAAKPEEKAENYAEALLWYGRFLTSFPDAPESPGINYQLADLHLEEEEFVAASREYERTAYDYPPHEQSSAAGYAAIYAHRQHERAARDEAKSQATLMAVESTLRFVETFPDHEHAPVVLGAAVDDLYKMKDLERALATGQMLIESYPDVDPEILRAAWTTVAHSLFDTDDFVGAEDAYVRVIEMTAEDDPTRTALVDNLAASIYKQGEIARDAEDFRGAADHFLRIAEIAPSSTIRPSAEYDAGAALILLEDWEGAASVLETFRDSYPDHELHKEATRQIAAVYRSASQPDRAAKEYERVAAESGDIEMRRDALLLAGELYEESEAPSAALEVYRRYVRDFPAPLDLALETRFKMAELLAELGQPEARDEQLHAIVALDRGAGDQRSDRVRYLAARSALQLTEARYDAYRAIEIVQPFQSNLRRKQQSMNQALDAFGELVHYEVGEVTAAATYYIAEIYFEFSRSLLESERPDDLGEADMLDYELVLEEEAYPFEERAIGVHEKNLELMSVGVYNAWVDKSLLRLADVMPGRYAKFEESPGPFESPDRYVYEAPAAVQTAALAMSGPDEPEGVSATMPELEPGATPEMAAEPEASPPAAPALEMDSEEAPPAAPGLQMEPETAPPAAPGPEMTPEIAPEEASELVVEPETAPPAALGPEMTPEIAPEEASELVVEPEAAPPAAPEMDPAPELAPETAQDLEEDPTLESDTGTESPGSDDAEEGDTPAVAPEVVTS